MSHNDNTIHHTVLDGQTDRHYISRDSIFLSTHVTEREYRQTDESKCNVRAIWLSHLTPLIARIDLADLAG